MPEYKNDSVEDIRVVDGNDDPKILKPGESSITNRYYDITNLTKVSDEPFINPLVAYNEEVFVAVEQRTIVLTSPDIAKIRIQEISGSSTFNIYLQSISNTPPVLRDWSENSYAVDIIVDGQFDQIIIESTTADPTTIQMLQFKER